MKARADDRRLFDSEAKPNVVAIQDSKGLNAEDITHALNSPINKEDVPKEYLFEEVQEEKDGLFSKKALAEKGHISQGEIASLLALFENAKTFGSLIQIPPKLAAKLPEIEKRLFEVLKHGDLTQASAHVLKPLLQQAKLLCRQYDAVVANPPFLGTKWMNNTIKDFTRNTFPSGKADLFSSFIERLPFLTGDSGQIGMVTPFVWMFISSFEAIRSTVFAGQAITTLVKPSYTSFFDSAIVSLVAFTIQKSVVEFRGSYFDLGYLGAADSQPPLLRQAIADVGSPMRHYASLVDFQRIPGQPIAYWASHRVREIFSQSPPLKETALPRQGMATSDNGRFLRRWHEVAYDHIGFGLTKSSNVDRERSLWVPYNKGGDFRKWYGNCDFVILWTNGGEEVYEYARQLYVSPTRTIKNADYFFLPCVTWSFVSSSYFGVRISDPGFIFDVGGSSAFPPASYLKLVAGYLCSILAFKFMRILNPTVNMQTGNIAVLPFPPIELEGIKLQIDSNVSELVSISRFDWDSQETSWGFCRHPLVSGNLLSKSNLEWGSLCQMRHESTKRLETENNRLFLEAFRLQNEFASEVPDGEITLYRPDREEDIKRLLSYAIGCFMGRYSLDKPGLIYAHSGNQGFDPGQYQTFRADDDGIIPLLETDWGISQDAADQFVEFIAVAWPKEHLEENLKFVAESLGPNNGEEPRETIRRYLATGFYKHHLSMYKKRPIYWLFSSGKQRAFQCLVYLHRYHEGTLARMRTEYVIPLQGQIAARIEQLEGDKAKATSTSHRKKLQKEQDDLKKQQKELATFEERLKHAADQKITLDLDDGVKVNYAKFGDLLAESKAITGGKDEE